MTSTGTAPATTRSRSAQLAVLTGVKVVSNTALRWVGPFLPTLERAFSATTGTLTGIMGVCELGGLSTAVTGPVLDRGGERRLIVAGLLAVSLSSVIALGGSTTTFAISFALLVIGVGNLTVAGHAWIGHRVAYASRGRAIGAFETSWAIALLVGAPFLAVLIGRWGWRAAYIALAIASAAAAFAVLALVSPGSATSGDRSTERARLPATAWPPMMASAATAAAGLGIFVVSGAWLDDAFGVSTGGLGAVAAGFGVVELMSSMSVVSFGDRIGARRSVMIGLPILGAGIVTMGVAGDGRGMAIAGLLVFLTGFEFAFVSSLTLVTETAPQARGCAIGLSNALGTIARASAVVASGQLYEAFGMSGSLAMAAVAGGAAVAMTIATRV